MALHMGIGDAPDTGAQGAKTPSSRTTPKPGRAKRIAIVAAILAVALCIGYAAGKHHYATHFMPGTTVGSIEAGGLTASELAELARAEVANYTDRVVGDGLDFTLSAEQIGLTMDADKWAADALASVDTTWWFLGPLTHTHVEPDAGVTLDEDLLAWTVSEEVDAFNETAEKPTDSTVVYDEEKAAFVATEAVVGTAISPDAVCDAVRTSALALRGATLLGPDQLAQPAFTPESDEIVAAIGEANEMLGKTFTLTLNGEDLACDPVDGSLSHSWIVYRNDDEGPEVYADKDKVWRWAYDTLNKVVNGENETETWEVDSPATSAKIAEALMNGQSGKLEVSTITTEVRPAESEGHETRGRHIDVNLSTQYARLYDEDGKKVLWRSYIVSGDASWGHDTPTGEYAINEMSRGVTLSGLNNGVVIEEGQEPQPGDYYVSYVDYWMCFRGTDYGLHDASWRTEDEFGGDTYLWNGSHGCVNLPVDAAEKLYNLVHVGDKVYIHY